MLQVRGSVFWLVSWSLLNLKKKVYSSSLSIGHLADPFMTDHPYRSSKTGDRVRPCLHPNFFEFLHCSTFVFIWQTLSNRGVTRWKRFVSRFTGKLYNYFLYSSIFNAPCMFAFFSSLKILQNFSDSPSHRIFRRMHGVLNIDEN